MLAIPLDQLLQRMDEIEIEHSEYVNRWRVLRATLESEAAQSSAKRTACPCCGREGAHEPGCEKILGCNNAAWKVGYKMWENFEKTFGHKFKGIHNFRQAKLWVDELQTWVEWHENAAKHRLFGVGVLAFLAGFGICWFVC